MKRTFIHGAGGVLSADIAVPDHERELGFYSKVLTTGESPLWRDDLMNNLGTPVIGLGERIPEYEMLPLQWMPHFQVADVTASTARAMEIGSKEIMLSKTDNGQVQWAALSDPAGAAFGLIPVVDNESGSAEQNERIGCISWLSLTVPDASAVEDFYQQVVGWKVQPIEVKDGERQFTNFEMQRDTGIAAAEICQYRDELEGIPAVWLIHLPVGDLAESLRRVSEGGGTVIKKCAEENYAVVRDPVGVYFALQEG